MKTDVRVAPSAVMLMAIEVSEKNWLVGFSNGTQRHRRDVRAWDVAGLLQAVEQARQKLGYAPQAAVRCCYEASRDGFSIHRMLEHHGIHNTVLDPASIEVDRRRRRSKTDRIDVDKLLRLHERHAYYGQHDGWRWARVPSTAAEAAMRPQRERHCLQRERTMHVNRIRALLALHGVRCGNVRRIDPAALRDWAGQPFAAEYQAQLTRELERLRLADQQLRAVEAGQRARLMARATPTDDMAWRLYLLRGIGLQGATTLAAEYFGWRAFTNRKQVGGLSGLCGSPYSSGESWREQGISKAGNRRVRTLLIQLAWLWIDWQPTSALTIWYQQRTAQGGARERRRMIVALARTLLVALWKYLEYGIVPDGAVMKSVRGRRLVA